MTQPLNYTPKAIADLSCQPCTGAPLTALGNRYLVKKLREAQVFVLGDSGQLLDRGRPRPEVPGLIFKPTFPVVALEYQANPVDWNEPSIATVACPRRIALAWEWKDDLPIGRAPVPLGEGVAVASLCWNDEAQVWVAVPGAMHIPYDAVWSTTRLNSPIRDEMIAAGRISREQARAAGIVGTSFVPMMPEVLLALGGQLGAAVHDHLAYDLMDEINAYLDLCYALACKNVSTELVHQPEKLNRARLKAGKLQLPDFHVLKLRDGEGFAGAGVAATGPVRDRTSAVAISAASGRTASPGSTRLW